MKNTLKRIINPLILAGSLALYSARAMGEENSQPRDVSQENRLIEETAKRVGVEYKLLRAIRKAENGKEGLEFGVIPIPDYKKDNGKKENGKIIPYKNSLEKQATWSAWTIRKNKQRYDKLPETEKRKYADYIDYLGDIYSPIKAKNDPKGLNKNWEKNVRKFYMQSIYK